MNRRGNSREFLRIGSLCAGLSLPWDRHGAEQERLEKRFDQAVFGYVPRLRRETRYKIGIKLNGTHFLYIPYSAAKNKNTERNPIFLFLSNKLKYIIVSL